MAYWMFIVQFIVLSLLSYSSSEDNFMKARDNKNNEFKDGLGIVNPGQTITIICNHNRDLRWSFTDLRNLKTPSKVQIGDRITSNSNSLIIKNIKFTDSGVYYCEKKGKNYKFVLHVYEITMNKSSSVPIKDYKESINGIDFTMLKIDEKQSVNVSCSCDTGTENARGEISWRGGAYKKLSDKYRIETEVKGTTVTKTLILKQAKNDRSLYGEYICSCNIVSRKEQVKSVYIKTPPIFNDFESSIRTSEGEKVTLNCEVWGYPDIDEQSLHWRFQNSTKFRSGINIINSSNSTGRSISLVIEQVTQLDRGLYTCHASNEIGSNIAGTMVRVKGKYAAVWPLIGIIIQLVILTVIIVVYEMKKKHQVNEETTKSNYDSRPEQDANAGERIGDQDVRQRLVKA